jgi:hypothetical protein
MKTCVVVVTFLLLAVVGCHRATANISSSPQRISAQMEEVSGRTFELEYGAPRTPNSQWRYRGLEGEYHIMDYYGLGKVYDQPEYRYSIRTRKDNLPKGFPTKPQPPVKTTISKEDEQYFDMMQQEERMEKIRSGEMGIKW